MTERRLAGLLICAALAPTTASPGEPDFSATASVQWSTNTSGARQDLQLNIEPEWQWRFDKGARLTALLRLRSHSLDALDPGAVTRASYGPGTRPLFIGNSNALELREFYLELPLAQAYLSLGKQQVVWGKADGLKVLDIVNPQSFYQFILEDFDDSRIPQWLANLETELAGWDLQLLWIPDQSYHIIADGGLYTPTAQQLAPTTPQGLNVLEQSTRRPSRPLADADYGIRLARFWHGWDLSLNYLYQHDNFFQPHAHLAPPPAAPAIDIENRYTRSHIIGGSASNAFGDWVLRGEAAYYTDREFLARPATSADGISDGAEFASVLGLDWSGLENTLISAQWFHSSALQLSAPLARDQHSDTFTLLVNHTQLNDTLELRAIWLTSANDEDGLIRLRATYDWRDDTRVWIGIDSFYGTSNGLYGQFDGNDRLSIGVEFGLQ